MARRSRHTLAGLVGAAALAVAAAPSIGYVCHPDPPGTRSVSVRGTVEGYALDGATVAVAVRRPDGCLSLVGWRPRSGALRPIAAPRCDGAMVAAVAAARGRAAWLTIGAADAQIYAASLRGGGARTVATSDQADGLQSLAGRGTVAFVTRDASGVTLRRLTAAGSAIVAHVPDVQATAVDGTRAALLQHDGTIQLWSTTGRLVRTVHAPGSSQIALRGAALVTLVPGSDLLGTPDRLRVFQDTTGRLQHTWPLPARGLTLDLYGGLAVVGSADGAYAVRLADGRAALVAVSAQGDAPQLGAAGLVFRDDLLKRQRTSGRTTLKLIPMPAVRHAVDIVGQPVTLPGPIHALAMDGPRVAVAVGGLRGACDQVEFWNVPWSYTSFLTMEGEYTCPRNAPHGPISALALSGVRAAWVTASGGVSRLVTATIVACEQHLVGQLRVGHGRFGALDGDSGLLAYTRRGELSVLAGDRGVALAPTHALAVSTDGGRVAALRAHGTVELRARRGRLLQVVRVGRADAIALRATTLVALGGGTLRVYDIATGRRLRSVRVPAGVRPSVDVEDGVAVLTARGDVYAVGLRSGRVAVAAQAPSAVVAARIETTGIAYGYDLAGLGRLRFVPLARALALVGEA